MAEGVLGPVMLDLDGTGLDAAECELLQHPLVGGVIFFARNYTNPEQLQTLVAAIRQLRPELLLAVDQEGGRVQRFKEGFTRLPSARTLVSGYEDEPARVIQRVKDVAWLMASELLVTGVDFSFAPVLDVDCGLSAVIGDRSFGSTPEQVVALAGAYIEGMQEAGMATTGKHFPGHGSVEADSHHELPVDPRAYDEVCAWDEKPFQALSAQLDGIMPAHICFPSVDEQPVGFSAHWLKSVLRQQLGFEGVIFSDDLSMAGASAVGGYGDRAKAALAAGCDMVLVCNQRQGALEVLESLSTESLPPSPRLATMAARQQPSAVELFNSERWQRTQQLLAQLEETD